MLIRRVHIAGEHALLKACFGCGVIILLALPMLRTWLESSLTSHMLVQIPLLVLAGWTVGKGFLGHPIQSWNDRGIPGLLLALFAMLFWMIPRWLDTALSEPIWEVVKFISIPLLIGLPLGMSWTRMTGFARAVVWCNGISMLIVIGWLYVAAPVRVCNNYLVNQQEEFGYTAMVLALFIAAYWIGLLFFGNWKKCPHNH